MAEMPDMLWVLTHVERTPIETYTTREEAEEARRRVLVDEPDWEHIVTVERFEFVEGDEAASSSRPVPTLRSSRRSLVIRTRLTLKRYTHLRDARITEAAERFRDVFGAGAIQELRYSSSSSLSGASIEPRMSPPGPTTTT